MAQPQPPPGAVPIQLQPGQQPTPEQIRQIQAQISADAQRAGLTVPEYMERMKQQMMQQAQMRQQQAQAAGQQGQGGGPGGQPGQPPPQMRPPPGAGGPPQGQQQVPIAPGPPKPEALAVAAFLRGQDLKMRTCIFQEKRKDMFRVKRAMRALQSDAYARARKKNALLPEVNDRVTAENTFKLLPMSMLALRVNKHDPHEGHDHGKKKRTKGLWTVKIEPQQEANDDFYYVWLYEGSQLKNRLYAVGALFLILAVVFFPVWPYHLRLGVWYLSMGMLGLLGLFFAMALFRLILFLITMFTNAPGLWLYPNLFEDVGFFDSFKPLWAWHEDDKAVKKRKKEERLRKKARRDTKENGKLAEGTGKKGKAAAVAAAATKAEEQAELRSQAPPTAAGTAETTTTGSEPAPAGNKVDLVQRNLNARVEEVEED